MHNHVKKSMIENKPENPMKNILLILIATVLLSSCAANTSFNSFYKAHEEDSDFSLGLSSSFIKPFLPDDDFEELKPLLKKAKHVRILTFSEDAADKSQQFDKFIKRSKFEKMVKVSDDGDKIAVFTLENKQKIKEVVLEVKSDYDLVLLGLKTNLTHEDLDKMLE